MKRIGFIFLFTFIFGCKDNTQATDSAVAQQQLSPEMKESISRGAGVYNNFCASCHLSGGEGIKGVFPPLKDSDWLSKKRKESIHAIKHGLRGEITVNGEKYDNLMPALGLSDKEIADVMNYINNSWGNSEEKPVTEAEVKAITK